MIRTRRARLWTVIGLAMLVLFIGNGIVHGWAEAAGQFAILLGVSAVILGAFAWASHGE